jgi:hypothetical protein
MEKLALKGYDSIPHISLQKNRIIWKAMRREDEWGLVEVRRTGFGVERS